MTTLTGSSSGNIARGPTPADADFAISSTENDVVVTPGTITYAQDYDAILKKNTPATVDPAYQMQASETVIGTFKYGLNWASSNTAVATVDAIGRASRVGNGQATIIAQTNLVTKGLSLDFTRKTGATSNTFLRFADNSLAKKICDAIDAALSGKDTSSMNVYSSTSPYTRNAGCFANAWDISGICATHSQYGTHCGVTAVANDCVIFPEHYALAAGQTLTFVAMDGTIENVTMGTPTIVPPTNATDAYFTDWQVAKITPSLSSKIKPLKVLPANWRNNIRQLQYGVAALRFNRFNKVGVGELYSDGGYGGLMSARVSFVGSRATFYFDVVNQDSGWQHCLIIGGAPVLAFINTYGGGGSGSNISYYLSAINTAMTAAGSANQLTTVDLSGEDVWDNDDYAKSVFDAYWLMTETSGTTFADSIGTNDAATHGGVTLAAVDGPIAGQTDKAPTFSGTGYASATRVTNQYTNGFTAAAWVKTTSNAETIYGGNNANSPYNGLNVGIGRATAGRLCYYRDPTATWSEGNTVVNDGDWHFVVVTGTSSSGLITFYVDGMADGSSIAVLPSSYSGTTRIGMSNSGTGGYTGQIMRMGIKTSPMPPTPIARLYALGVNTEAAWANYRGGPITP